ncbi:MAG: N-acetylneuraminate synthase family protein [Candidatus Sungbacteria bacterium]|nr:N-acetylneuraminate synthase family protein [bacterium]MDZ4260602.1 N-acetylneuraminate synthase family protein [Candidatus Sungbacteria bacterium]
MAKIIVEVCQNHNGDRTLLRDMIHAAKESGADIIKGQIIFSEDVTTRERFDEGYEENNGVRKTIKRPSKAEKERLAGLDLVQEDYHTFVDEVKKAGAVPMLTVFSRNRIGLAASLPYGGEKLVKVASYDCASHTMINELADHFDHLIISTGATLDEEIQKTAAMLKEKNKKFSLLHCVTSYPNTLAMAHLNRMEWLRQFTQSVGWSDHTLVARDGIKASKVALMLGADYIERHFTILPSDKTKDGPISITPTYLRELADFAKLSKEEQKEIVVKEISEWQIMLGHHQREMTHTEMLNRDYYRGRFASLVNNEWVYNWEDKSILS